MVVVLPSCVYLTYYLSIVRLLYCTTVAKVVFLRPSLGVGENGMGRERKEVVVGGSAICQNYPELSSNRKMGLHDMLNNYLTCLIFLRHIPSQQSTITWRKD